MPSAVEKLVIIGGSAGSLPVLLDIVESLPAGFEAPVVIVLHRLKNVSSDMDKILADSQEHMHIREPEDKEPIRAGHIYLAPQNYHLLLEVEKTFSLDYSELVHFSRPSIDVSFESAARVFGKHLTAVLLSGANQDGAAGIEAVAAAGGTAIVQDPSSTDYPAMPTAAIQKTNDILILQPVDIVNYFKKGNS
ncbi:chemotaxis protein CheB [Filimonas effusa]|uniref:protein-glutamate methylesterase n=1 Tax=Filimonas effusa TaxID=2508721 RepID=A0A4Q1D8L7_9BACT|nr:chemotaxis protein CheB [Filimonas effusa]RXK85631.1 chemotaxis protein CheB [Filimonas effusa]